MCTTILLTGCGDSTGSIEGKWKADPGCSIQELTFYPEGKWELIREDKKLVGKYEHDSGTKYDTTVNGESGLVDIVRNGNNLSFTTGAETCKLTLIPRE